MILYDPARVGGSLFFERWFALRARGRSQRGEVKHVALAACRPRRGQRLRAIAVSASSSPLLVALLVVCLAAPALAGSPLPFTPAFAAEVEAKFFESGAIAPAKLADYRAQLALRRREVVSVMKASYVAQGRKRKSAKKRALRKKEVRVYNVLLGTDARSGWLDELAAEADPVAARRLAGRILEVDYALLLEGARPPSIQTGEYMASISILNWDVPPAANADEAEREASNLWNADAGEYYGADELAALIRAGEDVSRLGPAPDSTIWRNPGAIGAVDVREAYLGGRHPVHDGLALPFPKEARLKKIRRTQIKPKFEVEVDADSDGDGESDGEERDYKLKVGGEIHSEPTVGALLATLGFSTDVVVHVKDFRIDIGDRDVEELRDAWRSYFEFKRMHLSYRFDDYLVYGEDERGRYLIAKEASLGFTPDELIRVGPWPWGANGNDGLREARALGLFNIWVGNVDVKESENNKLVLRPGPDGKLATHHVLHDPGSAFGRVMSEQIEAYPWEVVRRGVSGQIRFNYHSVVSPTLRKLLTYSDARWATRLIAQLTREQITEAVALGAWPESVAQLLVEKLIYRRNQLVVVFDLAGEGTPSGPIEYLAVDRQISTADGHVVDGELVDGVFEGATQEFDNYWQEFLGPVWEQAKLLGIGTFQKTIGTVPELIFDKDSSGLPTGVLVGLHVTIKREVEENPLPTGDDDYFLVRDRMLLGLRLGGQLIVTGTTGFWRSYTLVQPVGTRAEAHTIGNTILSVRLPYHVWKDQLPKNFVLTRESYLDGRLGLTTQSINGSLGPVGADWTGALARVSRDVLSQKNGRMLAYRDTTKYAESRLEAWLNFVIFRLPMATHVGRVGDVGGRLYELPSEATREAPAWSDALSRLIRDGDFSGIEGRVSGTEIQSVFKSSNAAAHLFFLAGNSVGTREDRVTISPVAGLEPSVKPVQPEEHFVQYRTGSRGFWAFIDLGEDHLHTVTSVVRASGPQGAWQPPKIVSTYFQHDRNTFDDELGDGYLRFLNGIAGGHGPLIEFTPSLHSVNGRWGDLEVGVRVGYSRKAVERLRTLEPETLWAQLAEDFGITTEQMSKQRRRMAARGKMRIAQRRRIPYQLRRPIFLARRVAAKLERANAEEDASKWMRDVVDALSTASPYRQGTFDPRVIGALHRLIDPEDLSIEATVEPPPWIENRLMSHVPLVAFTHDERFTLERPWVDFEPKCSAGIYTMLETFSGEDPVADRYGAICDGARGSFNY
jgi:hypothetical protein